MIEPDKLYTVNEVAAVLRSSTSNVYDLLKGKRLAQTCVGASGKGRRVRGRDLTAFLDSVTTGGPLPKFDFKHIKVG